MKIVCMRCIHPFHPYYVVHPVIDLADDDDRIDRHNTINITCNATATTESYGKELLGAGESKR